MKINVSVQTEISQSSRVRQLEGMFDCPASEKQSREWTIDADMESAPWNVGIIVGPSGAGKSTVARAMFGDLVDRPVMWGEKSVIDDFPADMSMDAIADICRAVGFNTIPAWMRPFHVLSTGEKFRVDLARRLIEPVDVVVVDEFTSVVDRQVAQIGSAAVAKYVRRVGKRFVAVGCHYDVIDWLQPDWVIEPHLGTFTRRSVQRRPNVDVEIRRVEYKEWARFAPYHYMSSDLNKAARCFVGFVDNRPAVFCGVLYRPHATARNIYGVSRMVTLPDFQGLGIGPAVVDTIASAYKAVGRRFRHYPAHPHLVRVYDQSKLWSMEKRPGVFSKPAGKTSGISSNNGFGGRPCAVFEYRGPALNDKITAKLLIQ